MCDKNNDDAAPRDGRPRADEETFVPSASDDMSVAGPADAFEKEFNDYLDQGSWAMEDTFEMTPDATAEQLQEHIDGWDYQTMDLKVVLFRDTKPDPDHPSRNGATGFYGLRDGVYGDVTYRINRKLGPWFPFLAHAYAQSEEEPAELYATFVRGEDGRIEPTIEEGYFRIYGGFSYDELMEAKALTEDPAEARAGVFGIWSRATGWVLPVTDNSVLLWRAYAEGLSNYLDVYWGDSWRYNRARYPMYYRNDPNDEPAILEDIAEYEAELERLVKIGADPTRHAANEHERNAR